jgi:hypothetical protein
MAEGKSAALRDRERLLRHLVERKKSVQAPEDRIAPRGTPGPAPLSFAQERLWFLEKLGLVGAAYNVPILIGMQGALDVGALGRAFRELIARHETLRTHVTLANGVPVQVISGVPEFHLEQIDLAQIETAERQRRLQELSVQESLQPFDLESSPLLRVKIVRMAALEHVMLLTLHHIVSDGWSLGVIATELGALYAQELTGKAAQLKPLSLQYADFACWQRDPMHEPKTQEHLQYWKAQLAGAPGSLDLPADRQRPRGRPVRLVSRGDGCADRARAA